MKDKLYSMRGFPQFKQGLEDLMNFIDKNSEGIKNFKLIEIGSYAGESTVIFAKRFKSIVAVDPWIENYDENDITCQHLPLAQVEKIFDAAVHKFDNISKFKLTSDDFFEKHKSAIEKAAPDVIYIDGIHTYEQVKKDIENAKKIKSLKFIAGHDYSTYWPGVVKAIIEGLGRPNAEFCDNSWIVKL